MDKNKLIESLDLNIKSYERYGLLLLEDMQILFNELGISREVKKGDNIIHAISVVQLAVIKRWAEDLK